MDVFVHIPKTAGSTLRAIISRQYGSERVFYYQRAPGEPDQPGLLRFLIALGGTRLVTGHYPYGIHELLKTRCRYFSMVRDPIKRAISYYYYAYTYPLHQFRDQILSGTLSLEEYLTDDRYSPGYTQAAMLMAGRRRSPETFAEAAIENASTGFLAVGTAERFAESVLQIARALHWKPPLFVTKNVTRLDDATRSRREEREAEAGARFKEHFKVDYVVYEAIDRLLSARSAEDGSAFTGAYEAFREIEEDIAAHTRDLVFEDYAFDGDDPLPEVAVRYVGSEPYRRIEEYLGSGDPRPPAGRNYIGHVDLVEDRLVAGWAADLSRFEPIHVTIRYGGSVVGTARCDQYREDLARAGLGTGHLAFRCRLAEPIRDRSDVSVCFEDSKIELAGMSP